MLIKRLFSLSAARGTKNYIDSQKNYEIARTLLYFAVSGSLFAAGWIQTGERINLLTVAAILGCLPASKSAVSAIMFLRFKSCAAETAAQIEAHSGGLLCLYDMVFTSYKKNFRVSHLAVCGATVCGYSEDQQFDENGFHQHIGPILEMDGRRGVTVKIFTDLPKYMDRLEQMRALDPEPAKSDAVAETLKSVAL